MKFKIQTCHSELYEMWFQSVSFIADAMQSQLTPSDMMLIGKLHKIASKMFKKLFQTRFLASSEVVKLSFTLEELYAFNMKITQSISLYDYVVFNSNTNNTVMQLDQKIKSI
jgi:hypothetical protein